MSNSQATLDDVTVLAGRVSALEHGAESQKTAFDRLADAVEQLAEMLYTVTLILVTGGEPFV
jgi:hypothetical protein